MMRSADGYLCPALRRSRTPPRCCPAGVTIGSRATCSRSLGCRRSRRLRSAPSTGSRGPQGASCARPALHADDHHDRRRRSKERVGMRCCATWAISPTSRTGRDDGLEVRWISTRGTPTIRTASRSRRWRYMPRPVGCRNAKFERHRLPGVELVCIRREAGPLSCDASVARVEGVRQGAVRRTVNEQRRPWEAEGVSRADVVSTPGACNVST